MQLTSESIIMQAKAKLDQMEQWPRDRIDEDEKRKLEWLIDFFEELEQSQI